MRTTPDLWYRHPAGCWEEALPLGNGRIGAMVFGGIAKERLALNEDTLWSGYPRDTNDYGAADYLEETRRLTREERYEEAQRFVEAHLEGPFTESYLPLGDLFLEQTGFDINETSLYERRLDIRTGVASTAFLALGVRYERRYFISTPDQTLVTRLSADRPGAICFSLSAQSQLRHTIRADGDGLTMDLRSPSHAEPNYVDSENPILYGDTPETMGMRARMTVRIRTDGGEISASGGRLLVRGTNGADILCCVRTSFHGPRRSPETEGLDEKAAVDADMKGALRQSFDTLLRRHKEDFSSYSDRTELCLCAGDGRDLATDERLKRFADTQDDPLLYELIFRYGRYLLISCSRPGTQAATLQGIWNERLRAPWSSNYTVNINTQMNYWPAECCGLSAMHEPLFDLIDALAENGERTARAYYHARGAVCHHNTDLWAQTGPVGNHTPGSAVYAWWPMSFGWLCAHLFERYEYTLDLDFLKKRAFPRIAQAARFFLDTLRDNGNGYLALYPATSPENSFLWKGIKTSVAKSAAMTDGIVREVLSNYLKCGELLKIEEDDMPAARRALSCLPPFKTGSRGQLLEWDAQYEECEPEHRHISPLYGLHPSRQIIPGENDSLADACRRFLELRGDEGTGWSLGWKINAWARLRDGDRALKLLKRQLRPAQGGDAFHAGGGTYPNLFDAHPPFQIDGNFGACAGIAEMLLQSFRDTLLLLPALPTEWREGFVRGLRARGGVEADIRFEEGLLKEALLRGCAARPVSLRIGWRGVFIHRILRPLEEIVLTARSFEQ